MNGRCETCDVEKQCGYKYKPCECCNYRKFIPLAESQKPLAPVYDFNKAKEQKK